MEKWGATGTISLLYIDGPVPGKGRADGDVADTKKLFAIFETSILKEEMKEEEAAVKKRLNSVISC